MNLSRDEVAGIIESFLNGTSGEWDWDDFISIPLEDPELEAVRRKCAAAREEFPPTQPRQYCGEQGVETMRRIAAELRAGATPNI